MHRRAIYLVVGLCCSPISGYADSIVYVSKGASGETVFSDVVSPDARRIEMTEWETQAMSSAEQVAQMLAVANDLAEARAAREAERAAKRKSTQPPVPLHPDLHIPSPDRYDRYGYFHPLIPMRNSHHPPQEPPAEPHQPPTKRIRFTPDL